MRDKSETLRLELEGIEVECIIYSCQPVRPKSQSGLKVTYRWEWLVGHQRQKAKGDIQMGVVGRTPVYADNW